MVVKMKLRRDTFFMGIPVFVWRLIPISLFYCSIDKNA